MKKVLASVFALSLASSAMAAGNVGIEVGSNWYKVNYTDDVSEHLLGQGQNVLLSWNMDNDFSAGVYSEAGTWSYDGGSTDDWEITAIQVSKGIVKNVAIGMNLGQMYNTWNSNDGLLTDVFGSVVVLGGSGDKVSGSLKTVVAARFHNDHDYDYSGVNINLVLGLLF